MATVRIQNGGIFLDGIPIGRGNVWTDHAGPELRFETPFLGYSFLWVREVRDPGGESRWYSTVPDSVFDRLFEQWKREHGADATRRPGQPTQSVPNIGVGSEIVTIAPHNLYIGDYFENGSLVALENASQGDHVRASVTLSSPLRGSAPPPPTQATTFRVLFFEPTRTVQVGPMQFRYTGIRREENSATFRVLLANPYRGRTFFNVFENDHTGEMTLRDIPFQRAILAHQQEMEASPTQPREWRSYTETSDGTTVTSIGTVVDVVHGRVNNRIWCRKPFSEAPYQTHDHERVTCPECVAWWVNCHSGYRQAIMQINLMNNGGEPLNENEPDYTPGDRRILISREEKHGQ